MKEGLDVLIVEDDADTLANLCDILELDGHRIHVADSFSAARQVILDSPVEMVILDRQLPDGLAEGFLPELRQLLPAAEIIVITGYAEMESTIAAFRLGVADYILKPINPATIRQRISRIVHQIRTQRSLEEERRFVDEVLATAEAVVLVLDLEGRVIRFNPYFTKISGWELRDLQGCDWFATCIPEPDQTRVRDSFLRTLHSDDEGGGSGDMSPIRTRGGRERTIRWSNAALKDTEGRTTSVLAIGVDVTDLIVAQELALRSGRLAAIGETMTSLAHESRNALQRIQAGVEMLTLEIDINSEARKDLDTIARASNDLRGLLEEIRSYAAPIHLHTETVSLPTIWRRVWDHLQVARSGRDAVLSESLCGSEHPIAVDVLRMEQVFRNLFENALAACRDPVRIRLQCVCEGADEIKIEIRDNGPGLSPEQREKLFEPFYTTKSGGTGLGLSIVQRIISAHQGEIQVGESAEKGACFVIRLPTQPTPSQRHCPVEV